MRLKSPSLKANPAGVLASSITATPKRSRQQNVPAVGPAAATNRVRLIGSIRSKCMDAKRQANIWSVRKAGLGLLYIDSRRFQADSGDRRCLGAGRAPRRVRGRGRRTRGRSTAPPPPTTLTPPPDVCISVRSINLKASKRRRYDEGDGVRGRRTRASIRRVVMSGEHGDGLQRSELNEHIFGDGALSGDAPVQGYLRSARADESGQKGRRAIHDRELPLRSNLPPARDQDASRFLARRRLHAPRSRCAMAPRSAEN